MTTILLRCPRVRRWLAGFAVSVASLLTCVLETER